MFGTPWSARYPPTAQLYAFNACPKASCLGPGGQTWRSGVPNSFNACPKASCLGPLRLDTEDYALLLSTPAQRLRVWDSVIGRKISPTESAFNACPKASCLGPVHECYQTAQEVHFQRLPKGFVFGTGDHRPWQDPSDLLSTPAQRLRVWDVWHSTPVFRRMYSFNACPKASCLGLDALMALEWPPLAFNACPKASCLGRRFTQRKVKSSGLSTPAQRLRVWDVQPRNWQHRFVCFQRLPKGFVFGTARCPTLTRANRKTYFWRAQ